MEDVCKIRTGMALLRQGIRVLAVEGRAEFGEGAAAGVERLGNNAALSVVNIQVLKAGATEVLQDDELRIREIRQQYDDDCSGRQLNSFLSGIAKRPVVCVG